MFFPNKVPDPIGAQLAKREIVIQLLHYSSDLFVCTCTSGASDWRYCFVTGPVSGARPGDGVIDEKYLKNKLKKYIGI